MKKTTKKILAITALSLALPACFVAGYALVPNSQHHTKIVNIEQQIKKMSDDIVNLETQILRITNKVKTLIEHRDILLKKIENEISDKEELGLQLFLLNKVIESKKLEINKLETEKQQLKQKIAELEKELALKNKQIDELQSKVDLMKEIKENEKNKLDELEKIIDEAIDNKNWLATRVREYEEKKYTHFVFRNTTKGETYNYFKIYEIPRDLKKYYLVLKEKETFTKFWRILSADIKMIS